jgi:hypothetical protein
MSPLWHFMFWIMLPVSMYVSLWAWADMKGRR